MRHIIPSRTVVTKDRLWQGLARIQRGTYIHCGNWNYYSHCKDSQKPKNKTPRSSSAKISTHWYSPSSDLLLRIAKIWRQSWYLLKSQLLNKLWFKHTTGYHLVVRNKGWKPVFASGCSQVEDRWERSETS